MPKNEYAACGFPPDLLVAVEHKAVKAAAGVSGARRLCFLFYMSGVSGEEVSLIFIVLFCTHLSVVYPNRWDG